MCVSAYLLDCIDSGVSKTRRLAVGVELGEVENELQCLGPRRLGSPVALAQDPEGRQTDLGQQHNNILQVRGIYIYNHNIIHVYTV